MKYYITPILLLILTLTACSGGGDGGGKSCNDSSVCGAGEFCNFTDLLCGENGKSGKCEAVPTACDLALVAPVCSCQGLSFFSECFSSSAGQSIRQLGECP